MAKTRSVDMSDAASPAKHRRWIDEYRIPAKTESLESQIDLYEFIFIRFPDKITRMEWNTFVRGRDLYSLMTAYIKRMYKTLWDEDYGCEWVFHMATLLDGAELTALGKSLTDDIPYMCRPGYREKDTETLDTLVTNALDAYFAELGSEIPDDVAESMFRECERAKAQIYKYPVCDSVCTIKKGNIRTDIRILEHLLRTNYWKRALEMLSDGYPPAQIEFIGKLSESAAEEWVRTHSEVVTGCIDTTVLKIRLKMDPSSIKSIVKELEANKRWREDRFFNDRTLAFLMDIVKDRKDDARLVIELAAKACPASTLTIVPKTHHAKLWDCVAEAITEPVDMDEDSPDPFQEMLKLGHKLQRRLRCSLLLLCAGLLLPTNTVDADKDAAHRFIVELPEPVTHMKILLEQHLVREDDGDTEMLAKICLIIQILKVPKSVVETIMGKRRDVRTDMMLMLCDS